MLEYCNVGVKSVYVIIRNVERDNNDTRRFIKSIDTEVSHLTRAQCCPLCES